MYTSKSNILFIDNYKRNHDYMLITFLDDPVQKV